MTNLAASISLYSSTSINEAFELPVSIATKFFESKSFESWKQSQESKGKMQGAIVDRLNSVINSIGVLAKMLSKRRF